MTCVTVPVDLGYSVLIDPGGLRRAGARVREVAPHPAALLACDERLASTHGAEVRRSLEGAGYGVTQVTLRATEIDKTMAAVQRVHAAMIGTGGAFDRTGPVVAVGGGIVGDAAGFAAATFLRGVPLVLVPTTLLAMVDASIGGKTGVNVELPDGSLGKNLVGAFWQPRAVLVDPLVLATLDPRDYRCGLAECVKTAMIADASLLDFLEQRAEDLVALHDGALSELIRRCAAIKAAIVSADEREAGLRALLNLGHTFAHAIEAQPRLGLRHGEAVAVGLAAACRCAVDTGRMNEAEAQRVAALLDRFGLPTRLPRPAPVDALLAAMRFDKKASAGRRRLVLPRGLGAAEVLAEAPDDLVRAAWALVGAQGS